VLSLKLLGVLAIGALPKSPCLRMEECASIALQQFYYELYDLFLAPRWSVFNIFIPFVGCDLYPIIIQLALSLSLCVCTHFPFYCVCFLFLCPFFSPFSSNTMFAFMECGSVSHPVFWRSIAILSVFVSLLFFHSFAACLFSFYPTRLFRCESPAIDLYTCFFYKTFVWFLIY